MTLLWRGFVWTFALILQRLLQCITSRRAIRPTEILHYGVVSKGRSNVRQKEGTVEAYDQHGSVDTGIDLDRCCSRERGSRTDTHQRLTHQPRPT